MSITEKSTDTKLNVSSLPFSTLPPKVYLLQKMIKQFLPVARVEVFIFSEKNFSRFNIVLHNISILVLTFFLSLNICSSSSNTPL